MGKARRLLVRSFAPSAVNRAVAGSGRAEKGAVARAVALKYPELAVYLAPENTWQARHHGNMFDSVAVGLTAIGAPIK